MQQRLRILLVMLAGFCACQPARAAEAADCLQAAAGAEQRYGIPDALLATIGRVETGRADSAGALVPWPWAIDDAGRGLIFADAASAIAKLKRLQARGAGPLDVGCFQVDLAYHPDAFATPEDAFDPDSNADYAARFLRALYRRLGNWPAAVAAYHSANPAIGISYRDRVLALWRGHVMPVEGFGMTIWTPDLAASPAGADVAQGLPHIIVPTQANQ